MQIGKQSEESQGLFHHDMSLISEAEKVEIGEYPTYPSPPCRSVVQEMSDDNLLTSICPSEIRFYQQYKKIYNVAYHLYVQKKRQAEWLSELRDRVDLVQQTFNKNKEKSMQNIQKQQNDNKIEDSKSKRARRTAEQIQKKYKCQVQFCQRFYGSQGSLQQHIKLKHPQLYVKEEMEKSQQCI